MSTNDDETRTQDDTSGGARTEHVDTTRRDDATSGRPTERRGFDRRSGLIAAALTALVLLVLFVGIGIGRHHGGEGPHGDRAELAFGGGPGRHGDGPPFGRGPHGAMGGGHLGRGGGPGGMGGGHMGGLGHGGIGVVTSASGDSLTVEPLGGPVEAIEVNLGDDVEIRQRGDDGPGDIEDAAVGDIDEGDIVAVRPEHEPEDAAGERAPKEGDEVVVDARGIIILRHGE